MKPLKKYLFLLILLLLALSALAGCSMVTVDGDKTDEAISDKAEIVSAEGFTVNGTALSLTVPNATTSLSFAGKITVSEGATWQLRAAGSNKNIDKTVELSTGDNTFSIVVTSESRANTATYAVTVRRRPLYTVSFDSDGGSTVAAAQVEEGAAIPAPADPTKRGYAFSGWDRDLSTPVTGNLTVNARWTAIRYDIVYELNGGTNAAGNPATYTVEDAITLQAPSKGDRPFLGWSDGGVIPVGSTGNKTFTANWMNDTDAYYTVEHYLQNKAGTGYEKASSATEKKAGAIGSHVTAEDKTFEHYAYAPGKSTAAGDIASDGSLVLKLYYDRVSYTVTFLSDGGRLTAGNATPSVRYGNALQSYPTFARDGYEFAGWDDVTGCNSVEGDLTVHALWTATSDYEKLIQRGKAELGATEVFAPSREGVVYARPLPAPASLGTAASRAELVEIANYYAFYRTEEFSVALTYPASNAEDELNALYYDSELIPSLCAVTGSLSAGVLHVDLIFYPETYLVTPRKTVFAGILGGENTKPNGTDTLPGLDPLNGISVWDSEQVCYALSRGYTIAPIEGSPAAELVEAAREILSGLVDDTMNEFQIAYRVYRWLMENAPYDYDGDHWASNSLDPAYQPEMVPARMTSFRAEGPILYGGGVCFGYAKAAEVLLGLEGLRIRRVVSFAIEGYLEHTPGRSWVYGGTIQVHSYNYFRVNGYDYLFDLSFGKDSTRTVQDGTTGNAVELAVTKDFCVGLSKAEQITFYSEFPTDPFSSSAEYNPGSYHYLSEITYDGEHVLLLSSPAEAQTYYTYLKNNVFNGDPAFRTVTLFYAGVTVSEWNAQYYAGLNSFLKSTGVPYSTPNPVSAGERAGGGVRVVIAFGK